MDLKNNKGRKQDTVFTERASKLRKLLGRIKSTGPNCRHGMSERARMPDFESGVT
jgi:hypothetical protein